MSHDLCDNKSCDTLKSVTWKSILAAFRGCAFYAFYIINSPWPWPWPMRSMRGGSMRQHISIAQVVILWSDHCFRSSESYTMMHLYSLSLSPTSPSWPWPWPWSQWVSFPSCPRQVARFQGVKEGLGLVVHFSLGCVAKINTPWPRPCFKAFSLSSQSGSQDSTARKTSKRSTLKEHGRPLSWTVSSIMGLVDCQRTTFQGNDHWRDQTKGSHWVILLKQCAVWACYNATVPVTMTVTVTASESSMYQEF